MSVDGLSQGPQNVLLFVERKRGAFPQRAQRDHAHTPVLQQPAAMLGEERMIDTQILIERSGDCRCDAFPIHLRSPSTAGSESRYGTAAAILAPTKHECLLMPRQPDAILWKVCSQSGELKMKSMDTAWKDWLPPRDSNPDSLLQRQVS